MSISIGTRLGAYEILQPIGQGGMGQVFRARDTRLQRDVAVKLVRPDVFNADRAERFRREARALAALGHQNIASVADHDTFTAATREGVVIGTAAYMSPEQARGQEVDRRTDIWSFGCVLFEMLTGRQAFSGSTSADTIAAVIERNIDWSVIPADTPPELTRLVRRCLQRDLKQRLRDLGDGGLELEDTTEYAASRVVPAPPGWHRALWALVLLTAGAAIGSLVVATLRSPRPEDGLPARFVVTPPPSAPIGGPDFPSVAMAPDGTRVVYVASRGGRTQLFCPFDARHRSGAAVGDDECDRPVLLSR